MELKPLREILRAASSGLIRGFLYLPKDEKWTLDTRGIIINDDELNEEDVTEYGESLWAVERGLVDTLDSETIEAIAANAKDRGVPLTDELLFEAFMYYFDYDAFLPSPGAYDPTYVPPPREERILEAYRWFYNSLGEERHDVRCKKEGCSRGALPLRIFCKVHHFEMMNKTPCLFSD